MKDQHLNVKCKQSAIQCFSAVTSGPQMKVLSLSLSIHFKPEPKSNLLPLPRSHGVIHWLEFKLQINKAIQKYFHLWYLGAKLQFVLFRFIEDYSHINIHKTGIKPKLIASWSSTKWSLLTNYARIRTHDARRTSQSLPTEPAPHSALLY